MTQDGTFVVRQSGSGWAVTQPADGTSRCYGQFRFRVHAEAFGRALAHRGGVPLIVHYDDGRQASYAAATLSYPAKLS